MPFAINGTKRPCRCLDDGKINMEMVFLWSSTSPSLRPLSPCHHLSSWLAPPTIPLQWWRQLWTALMIVMIWWWLRWLHDDDVFTENLWIDGRLPQSCLIAGKYWSVLPIFALLLLLSSYPHILISSYPHILIPHLIFSQSYHPPYHHLLINWSSSPHSIATCETRSWQPPSPAQSAPPSSVPPPFYPQGFVSRFQIFGKPGVSRSRLANVPPWRVQVRRIQWAFFGWLAPIWLEVGFVHRVFGCYILSRCVWSSVAMLNLGMLWIIGWHGCFAIFGPWRSWKRWDSGRLGC